MSANISRIWHRQLLKNDLVFPRNNIAMKPSSKPGKIFFITTSITGSFLIFMSWQSGWQITTFCHKSYKIYPPIKLKQVVSIFIFNHINKFYLSWNNVSFFLQIFQWFNTPVRFLFNALLCCHFIVKQWHFL